MSYEQDLGKNLFKENTEKSFIDKILARKEIGEVQALIKKPTLDRSELLELLYLLTSTEAKLVNYDEWDRYIILKFFVWIRDFIKIVEGVYDYSDMLTEFEKQGKIVLSAATKRMLKNVQNGLTHNAKFMIDLYFNMARTTLSIKATGIIELLKNRFEVAYPYGQAGQQVPPPQTRIFGLGRKEK